MDLLRVWELCGWCDSLMCTHTHTYKHTHTQTHHTYTHTRAHTHTHTHTHTRTHACTHTHTRTHISGKVEMVTLYCVWWQCTGAHKSGQTCRTHGATCAVWQYICLVCKRIYMHINPVTIYMTCIKMHLIYIYIPWCVCVTAWYIYGMRVYVHRCTVRYINIYIHTYTHTHTHLDMCVDLKRDIHAIRMCLCVHMYIQVYQYIDTQTQHIHHPLHMCRWHAAWNICDICIYVFIDTYVHVDICIFINRYNAVGYVCVTCIVRAWHDSFLCMHCICGLICCGCVFAYLFVHLCISEMHAHVCACVCVCICILSCLCLYK